MENKFIHKDDIIRLRERTIEELQSELTAAHARIAELERCVVMGGDGKPIKLRERYWFRDGLGMVKSVDALTIDAQEYGYEIIHDGKFECEPQDCYSSPDSVPEGDKE